MDKQREMFEAWLEKQGKSKEKSQFGPYFANGAELAWSAWQAAIAAQQPCPRCACGDSFTSDAVCANCLAAEAAEWEPTK